MKGILIIVLFLINLYADETLDKIINDFKKEEATFSAFKEDAIGKKSLASMRYKYASEYLKSKKNIDIKDQAYHKALLYAESSVQLDSTNSEYWLVYATLLLALENVPDAQVSAQIAAEIALDIEPKNYTKAKIILLQSYVNQLQFHKANEIIDEILKNEPILMNHPAFIDSYIASHLISSEVEDGIDKLHYFLIKYPSSYGAMIAQIKLYQMAKHNLVYEKEIDQKIAKLKKDLKVIYEKFHSKLSFEVTQYIQEIFNEEQS